MVENVVSQQPAPVPCCNSFSTTMDSSSETIGRASSSFYKQPLFTTIDHSNRIVTNIPSSTFFQNKIEFYSPQIAYQLKDSYFFPLRLLLIWGINSMYSVCVVGSRNRPSESPITALKLLISLAVRWVFCSSSIQGITLG